MSQYCFILYKANNKNYESNISENISLLILK